MKRERKIGTRGDDHEDVNMGMKKKASLNGSSTSECPTGKLFMLRFNATDASIDVYSV